MMKRLWQASHRLLRNKRQCQYLGHEFLKGLGACIQCSRFKFIKEAMKDRVPSGPRFLVFPSTCPGEQEHHGAIVEPWQGLWARRELVNIFSEKIRVILVGVRKTINDAGGARSVRIATGIYPEIRVRLVFEI